MFEDLGVEPHGEGILTLAVDVDRKRMYGITWPSGCVVSLQLPSASGGKALLQCHGRYWKEGELGEGDAFRTLCRCMVVVPDDGSVREGR